MTKEIELTQGYIAIVDDEDFDRLSAHKWHCHRDHNKVYARRHVTLPNGKRVTIRMHREILNVSDGIQVDHRDGDGLNNTRGNLRPATSHDNQHNRGKQKNNSSGYKGVSWYARGQKWRAQIKFDGRIHHVGLYDSPAEAACAYDEMSRSFHGEFAYTNFP